MSRFYKFPFFLLSFFSSFICIILYRIFSEYTQFHSKYLSTNTRSSDHYHYGITNRLSYSEHLRQDHITNHDTIGTFKSRLGSVQRPSRDPLLKNLTSGGFTSSKTSDPTQPSHNPKLYQRSTLIIRSIAGDITHSQRQQRSRALTDPCYLSN